MRHGAKTQGKERIIINILKYTNRSLLLMRVLDEVLVYIKHASYAVQLLGAHGGRKLQRQRSVKTGYWILCGELGR